MSAIPLTVSESDRPGASFETFYGVSRARIFRAVALVLGDSDIALDATEEAMTRAAERWGEVGTYENPAGWVYRVALNWARTHLRRLARERGSLQLEPGYEQRLPDPEVLRAEAKEHLSATQSWVKGVNAEHRLLDGDPVTEILRVAREIDADVILLGSHGRTGLTRLLMGSVAEQVVRKAPCPVVVIKVPTAAPRPVEEPEVVGAGRS